MTEPYAALAATGLAVAILAAWGFGEGIALPVVPDVLLGILVLAAPAEAPLLFGVTVAAGAAGGIALWAIIRHRPAVAREILRRQPALGEPGLAEARDRLRQRGPLLGFAQLGPGLPLKAYVGALAETWPASGYLSVALYALVNRLARLGPPTLAFALAAPLAAGRQGDPILFGSLYFASWAVFYGAYWAWRDPRRRGGSDAPPA